MQNSIIFTSSTVWTVPLDWSNLNSIIVVGAGQGGGSYYRQDGGNRLVYAYGGAGGGYSTVQNLNSLVPGQTITVQVGAGGYPASSGSGPGGSGSDSSFGGYVTATAGRTIGTWPYMAVGVGNYSSGSFGTLAYGGSPGYGGNAGSPGYGSYGKGGNSQNWYSANYPYTGAGALTAQPGQNGVILVSYTPSGTHQACVWIS